MRSDPGNCELHTHASVAGLSVVASPVLIVFTLMKKIVWTPSKQIELRHEEGDKAVSECEMLQVRQRQMIYQSQLGKTNISGSNLRKMGDAKKQSPPRWVEASILR